MRSFFLSIFVLFGFYIHGAAQPLSLVSPGNNLTIDTTNILFSWNSYSGVGITYHLQIASDNSFSANIQNITNINNDTIILNSFSLGDSYFWHVRAYNGSVYSGWSNIRKFTIINPSYYSDLQLWLKTDKGIATSASSVISWTDQSSNHYYFSQPTSSYQPLLVTGSAVKPAVYFNVDDFLLGPTITGINNNSLTCFSIASGESYSNNELLGIFTVGTNRKFSIDRYVLNNSLIWINNDDVSFRAGNLPSTGFPDKIFSLTKNIGNISNIYINGTLQGSTTNSNITGSFTNDVSYIGTEKGAYGNGWKGNISEVIIYNSLLNDNERQEIEKYIKDKYYPSVNLGHDIYNTFSFCPISLDAGSRFTSFQWSTGETNQTIQVGSTGTYSVTVTDIFGYTSSDTITITYPQISLHDTLFCSGSSATLSTGLTGSYTYNWSNGPTTPTINVNTPGNYSVTITDASSCTAVSNTIYVSEDNFPTTASLGPDAGLCSGNTIGLISPSPLPLGLTYNWSTLATTPTIPITTSGSYAVTVTDLNSCTASDNITVTIVGTAPEVHFTNTQVCEGESMSFTNNSIPAGTSWLWDFGDGQTSTFQNPSHIYDAGGDYNVSLTVTDGLCSNTFDSTIHVSSLPVAAFSPGTACVSYAYTFSDESYSTEGNIITWDWDFGDGSLHSNDTNPQHTYSTSGNYNVSLTIQTEFGCQNSVVLPINVVVSAPLPEEFTLYLPTENFVTTDHIIDFAWNKAPEAANYTLQYSYDPEFGSGVTSIPGITSTNIQLSINVAGTYYWRILANNICGHSTISDVFNFTIFSSSIISGMQLWLKADSAVQTSGSNVTQWNDCSGSNHHASQSNTNYQPSLIPNSINFKPAIKFDGVNDILNGGTILNLGGSSISIFVLTRGEAQSGVIASFFEINNYTNGFTFGRRMYTGNLSLYNNGEGIDATPTPTMPNSGFPYKIATGIKSYGSNTKLYLNTVLASTSANSILNGPFSNANYKIGFSELWNYLNGEIAEIILYNKALSQTERNTVDWYLRNKYAPPVNLGPDIWANNFCSDTLEAGERFAHYKWNTKNLADTLHYLVVTSGGHYSVTATDVFGFKSTDTVIVHKPVIAVHDTTICIGNNVVLNTGLGAPFIFNWTPGNFTDSAITVAPPADVTLTVYDTEGCSAVRQIVVSADSFPVIASLGPDRNVCTGEEIGLVAGLVTGLTYDWYDGSTHIHDSIYTVNWTSGTHTLTLTVTNARGCVATDQINVSVQGQLPVAAFSASANCYPTLTSFTDNSTVGGSGAVINQWNWDFGDGNTSTIQHPSYYYATPGIHLVSLTVTSNQGCSKSLTQQVPVYSVPDPHFGPVLGCTGVPMEFHDLSTNLLGDITIQNWDFGDGNTASGNAVIHTYINPGTDTVQLYVESEYGCSDSISMAVNIRSTPDVGFMYSSVCDGNPVYFTDTSKVPNVSANIINWLWDFGNGNTSTFQNPVYTFDNAGTYPVVLSVKSINGCMVNDTQNVVVHALPVAGFSSEDVCMGSPHQFVDTSSVLSPDAVTKWTWDFGAAGTSVQQNPVIGFATQGMCQISLEVTSNAGCKDFVTHSVNILPSPVAAFLPDEYYGEANFTVNFSNNSTGLNNTYLWNFGDTQGSSTLLNPSYTYTENGIYDVALVAYNQYGCTDTAHQEISVIPTIADIAVTAVNVLVKNNYVTLSAELTNMGSRKLYALDVMAKAAGGTTFKESWADLTDPLIPGETMTFDFTAQYQLTEEQITEYICIESQIQGIVPDDLPSNNEECATLSKKFTVFQPYPSPAHDAVNLDFILPFADDIVIDLYGIKGELIRSVFNGQAEKGLNKIAVDLANLQLGVYSFRVLFKDDVKILKFVVY